ncbi:Uncharacterised protein [uncultured archaeon]|nr:Uncharacterised protein [uncultured archaeon]
MEGISSHTIKRHLGADAIRMMPSSPNTIQERRGIAAIYPHNDILSRVLAALEMQVYRLPAEDLMHAFTVGVCLPAALLAIGDDGEIRAAAIGLAEEYPDFPKICAWARDVLPKFERDEDRENYIRRTATKGGITEAIIESLSSGKGLYQSLRKGIDRSREISRQFDDRK